MIYKKSILLICCCKLCCVYCGPKGQRLMGGYDKCKNPNCPDIVCNASVENAVPDKLSAPSKKPMELSQIGSDINPMPFSDTKVEDNLVCSDVNCNHPDFGINSSHVGCGTGCIDFLYTLQDKFNLLGWIMDLWYFRNHNNKCCTHKHGHSHYKHPPSLVAFPEEVTDYIRKACPDELTNLTKKPRGKKHSQDSRQLEINQPIPRS